MKDMLKQSWQRAITVTLIAALLTNSTIVLGALAVFPHGQANEYVLSRHLHEPGSDRGSSHHRHERSSHDCHEQAAPLFSDCGGVCCDDCAAAGGVFQLSANLAGLAATTCPHWPAVKAWYSHGSAPLKPPPRS